MITRTIPLISLVVNIRSPLIRFYRRNSSEPAFSLIILADRVQ